MTTIVIGMAAAARLVRRTGAARPVPRGADGNIEQELLGGELFGQLCELAEAPVYGELGRDDLGLYSVVSCKKKTEGGGEVSSWRGMLGTEIKISQQC